MATDDRERCRAILGLGLELNIFGQIPDGTPGVRDADAVCEYFETELGQHERGSPGTCWGDGHYLCKECVHLSEEPAP